MEADLGRVLVLDRADSNATLHGAWVLRLTIPDGASFPFERGRALVASPRRRRLHPAEIASPRLGARTFSAAARLVSYPEVIHEARRFRASASRMHVPVSALVSMDAMFTTSVWGHRATPPRPPPGIRGCGSARAASCARRVHESAPKHDHRPRNSQLLPLQLLLLLLPVPIAVAADCARCPRPPSAATPLP
jgi:hypothetical protein